MNTDLQTAATPEELPKMLRAAADLFAQSQSELVSSWQDRNAGRVWGEFARIMERAAASCELAIAKHV
jgi:hypothetical protein